MVIGIITSVGARSAYAHATYVPIRGRLSSLPRNQIGITTSEAATAFSTWTSRYASAVGKNDQRGAARSGCRIA
jgi:hypothetical protein